MRISYTSTKRNLNLYYDNQYAKRKASFGQIPLVNPHI